MMAHKTLHGFPTKSSSINIPTRADLAPKLNRLAEQIVNFSIPTEEMINIISFYLSQTFKVHVMHANSYKCPPDIFIVTTEYDPALDLDNTPCIFVTLISFPNVKTYLWDQDQFDMFSRQICDGLIRELVHLRQYRKRNYLDIPVKDIGGELEDQHEKLYLSQPDEIDAYAHTIASELAYSQLDIKDLSTPSKIEPDESLMLWNYGRLFDHNINHPVMKRLLKKVYKLVSKQNH